MFDTVYPRVGTKAVCVNCGAPIVYVEGIHITDYGWAHDEPGNHTFACIPSFAEPEPGP